MRDLTVIAWPGSEATTQAVRLLREAGFQVSCSFDLQTTRAFQSGCDCPHHGADCCDCQYAVLQIQPPGQLPLTLLVHGRDGLTWFALADEQMPDSSLSASEQVAQIIQSPHSWEAEAVK
jgi:hypothetical protein